MRKDLNLNPVILARTIKGERNLYIELQKDKLDQIMQEKHENFSGQTYSFLEVKLQSYSVSEEKRRRANMVPVTRIYLLYSHTVLIIAGPGVTI